MSARTSAAFEKLLARVDRVKLGLKERGVLAGPAAPERDLHRLHQAVPQRDRRDEREARARDSRRLRHERLPTRFDVLVIGAGIAGLQSSLDLADQGFSVGLVERDPSIGGAMIGLSKVFPDPGLRELHHDAAHGLRRAPPQHHDLHPYRGRGGAARRRSIPRHTAPEAPLRDRG